jgi:hypothetical protein
MLGDGLFMIGIKTGMPHKKRPLESAEIREQGVKMRLFPRENRQGGPKTWAALSAKMVTTQATRAFYNHHRKCYVKHSLMPP